MSHFIHKFKKIHWQKKVHFPPIQTTNAELNTAGNKQSYTKENDEKRDEKLQRSLKPTTIYTAKQSVFLRIQVHASSETRARKTLTPHFFTDFEKKTDCFAVKQPF